MGDMGEMYRDWNVIKKERKEENKLKAFDWLKSNNIDFKCRNESNHLIVSISNKVIDFWPTTNKAKIEGKIVCGALERIKKIYYERGEF